VVAHHGNNITRALMELFPDIGLVKSKLNKLNATECKLFFKFIFLFLQRDINFYSQCRRILQKVDEILQRVKPFLSYLAFFLCAIRIVPTISLLSIE
jgi:hypothetical protein